MLVIPEEPEINHIVVIVDMRKQNTYDAHWYRGVYVLKKDAAEKWAGSQPGRSLEYQAEVDMSHPDRIGIVVKREEYEYCRTTVTRREGSLFAGTHTFGSVTAVIISDSEKNSLPFENGECAYLVIRSDSATVLRQSAADSEGLRACELPWGSGSESEEVGVAVRQEESGIRVIWPNREARLWNANGNWVGVYHEWKWGLMGGKRKIKRSLVWMIPDPLWTPSGCGF